MKEMRKPVQITDLDEMFERLAGYMAHYGYVSTKYAYVRQKPPRKGSLNGRSSGSALKYDSRTTVRFKDAWKDLVQDLRKREKGVE